MDLKTRITENQVLFQDENEKTLAYVTYETKDGAYVVTHTYVSEILRGQGIASKLMSSIYELACKNNKKIEPVCSYAVEWCKRNQDT